MSEGSKMRLLEERQEGRVRVRVLDCNCLDRECDELLIVAATHPELWVVCGKAPEDHVDDAVELLLSETELGGDTPADLVDVMTALVGLRWAELVGSRSRAALQFTVWDLAPAWMLKVPLDRLWRTRGCVFGDDLTRVPRALQALERFYDPGGRRVDVEVLP